MTLYEEILEKIEYYIKKVNEEPYCVVLGFVGDFKIVSWESFKKLAKTIEIGKTEYKGKTVSSSDIDSYIVVRFKDGSKLVHEEQCGYFGEGYERYWVFHPVDLISQDDINNDLITLKEVVDFCL